MTLTYAEGGVLLPRAAFTDLPERAAQIRAQPAIVVAVAGDPPVCTRLGRHDPVPPPDPQRRTLPRSVSPSLSLRSAAGTPRQNTRGVLSPAEGNHARRQTPSHAEASRPGRPPVSRCTRTPPRAHPQIHKTNPGTRSPRRPGFLPDAKNAVRSQLGPDTPARAPNTRQPHRPGARTAPVESRCGAVG